MFICRAAVSRARVQSLEWHTEIVDRGEDTDWYTSLALDAAGAPHITYYDYTHQDLQYARFTDAGWVTATVASAGAVGKFNNLALDDARLSHVSYYRVGHSWSLALKTSQRGWLST